MTASAIADIRTHFAAVEDPRIDRTKWHELLDIIVITICAAVSGADSWTEVEEFGWTKLEWLRKFMSLENGIPSHDTFGEVFKRLNPEQFQAAFLNWVQAVMGITGGQVVAVDGKELRRSHDHRLGKAAIQMVSAWASQNQLVLGQVKVDAKSNEITAIPALLQLLDLAGCIVTVDALGTQKEIAQAVLDAEADYVLAVKGNQGHLHADLIATFEEAERINFAHVPHETHTTVTDDHGRHETRQIWTISREDYLEALRDAKAWPGLRTMVMVRSQRRIGTQTSTETRYYISSLPGHAQPLLAAVRSHWGVESFHWLLDVVFNEDRSRLRKGHAAENFAVVRHAALNLLKREKSLKLGLKAKRLKAALDDNYRLKVLAG